METPIIGEMASVVVSTDKVSLSGQMYYDDNFQVKIGYAFRSEKYSTPEAPGHLWGITNEHARRDWTWAETPNES